MTRSLNLSQRDRQPELMDDPALGAAPHHAALRGLERINRLSRSVTQLWRPIHALAAQHPQRELRLLDIATGGGDLPIGLSRLAKTSGIKLNILACDTSPQAIAYAQQQAAAQKAAVDFFVCDVLSDPLPQGVDIITCSLFLHHLSESDTLALLRRLREAAREMIVISDLRRSRIGYALALLVPRLLTRCTIVHTDGPLSVRGAYTLSEAQSLAQQAGLKNASFKGAFPWRWLMTWKRGGA